MSLHRKKVARLAKYAKKSRHGFKLVMIVLCLIVLLILLAVVFILSTGGSGKLPEPPTDPTVPAATAGDSFDAEDPQNSFHQAAQEEKEEKINLWDLISDALDGDRVKENEDVTFGVDVAKYQGTIDWEQVAASGVDFAIVRLGYRTLVTGEITEDTNAAYNLQQAQKYGLKLGAYFFSTAVSKEEAIEEANWVADYLAPYAITYPVAYNCEGFNDPNNRQYGLTKHQRTEIALAFLKQIEKRGYEAMFYASKNEMEDDAQWQVSRIDPDYKIWVAQYPEKPYPETEKSSYSGVHHMWQYTRNGQLPGIPQGVDVNVAYFGYDGTNDAQSDETVPTAAPDPEALMEFTETSEQVTAKKETNLRDIPSQGEDSTVLHTLKNGEIATRIGISDSGWSKVEFQGKTYYALSSLLTTNISGEEPAQSADSSTDDDGIQTEFREVSDNVTAKDAVNLRSLPSTTHPDCKVVAQLKKGEVIKRTGVNDDVGWSRVEYQGQVLYCITSYLEVVP